MAALVEWRTTWYGGERTHHCCAPCNTHITGGFFFSSAFVTWELHGIKLRFFFYPCVAVMMEPDAYSTCRPSRSGAARDHVQFRKLLLLYSVYTPPIHYTYSDSVHCCHTNAGTTHINSV